MPASTGRDMGEALSSLEIIRLGRKEYSAALATQKEMVAQRVAGITPDRLLLTEHPSVITMGRSGAENDLTVSRKTLHQQKISCQLSDRGGKTTFHNPGQLVAYPILKLTKKDVHWYVSTLLGVVTDLLRDHGLSPIIKQESPGVWVNDKKIASIGVAMKKWVTYHGIALNVNNDLAGFKCIIPCGMPGQQMTSMKQELGLTLDLSRIETRFVAHFKKRFDFEEVHERRHPRWLTVPSPDADRCREMKALLNGLNLSTVCQSAHCPNMGECYGKGTATFMILGNHCTRGCRFCAVDKGTPPPVDPLEPERVASAVAALGLHYAVVTSVTRDDLPDGGAKHFADTIRAIRRRCPHTRIEILVPDFMGIVLAVDTVLAAKPDMFNHNIETVPRLYPMVRPQANYKRSLGLLARAADQGLAVKSGIMLGLGELPEEIASTLKDLRKTGCEYLTMGQYLAPSKKHLPVSRYLSPDEFAQWHRMGKSYGFKEVASGPLVRSSYRAEEVFNH
ncbi:Lipoate-protein ligase B/lipoate synthase [Desulfosarcina cetonica]|nr:Lipoate-protein ligase B/lipoate synthase [Desulfosarcina cetonica]